MANSVDVCPVNTQNPMKQFYRLFKFTHRTKKNLMFPNKLKSQLP